MLKTEDGERTTPKKFVLSFFESLIAITQESDEDLFEALFFALKQKPYSKKLLPLRYYSSYEKYELSVRNTLTQKELDEVALQLAKIGTRLARVIKALDKDEYYYPLDVSKEGSRVEDVRSEELNEQRKRWNEA